MGESRHGRSRRPRKFFDAEEQRSIVAAIHAAEGRTSGEIRLHVEREVPARDPIAGDPYARARGLFGTMGMHLTAERNGVLIYISLADRRVAVVGDEMLHDAVGEDFWREVVDFTGSEFASGRFLEGVNGAVSRIGAKLRENFPFGDDDANELPDEISFAD